MDILSKYENLAGHNLPIGVHVLAFADADVLIAFSS